MKSSVACFEINARTGLGQIYNSDVFIYSWTKFFKYICIQKKKNTKTHKEGFRKVFNVWTKSHFSNFEVG